MNVVSAKIASSDTLLSNLLSEHARHVCAVNKIQAKASDGATVPPHWIATAADLPAFFQWLEKSGLITTPPELFTGATLRRWLVRLLQAKENGILACNAPAAYIRDKLTESPVLTDAERAMIPRPHTFKKLLQTLSDEPRETRIVTEYSGGKFCVENPKPMRNRV
jgi:hypothetical protein